MKVKYKNNLKSTTKTRYNNLPLEGNRLKKRGTNETKKSMIQPSEIISDRTIPIKNEIAERGQSSRQKSVELLGLPNNISNGDFEEVVLKTFEEARIKVMTRNFHAIHWLWNKNVIKAKLVNRPGVLAIPKTKNKLPVLLTKWYTQINNQ